MRIAVIDIGSNSTRLLVADVAGGRVREVDRRTAVTRLARGVETAAQLSAEAIEDVCAAIDLYLGRARELDAERTVALATSAVRDAANGDAFLAELRERFALAARTIDGAEEALLTYRGATAALPADGETLVIDIGGGSTELVAGSGPEPSFQRSLQVGVVRHMERHVRSDPPTAAELEELADDVRGELEAGLGGAPRPDRAIAVAGTPTSLAAIDLDLEPYDPRVVEGHALALERVRELCSRLSSVPLAERRRVRGLHPDRAPTIVAGTIVLIALMRRFGLDSVRVSERDILWGAALAAAEDAG